MMGRCFLLTLFLLFDGVFGDDVATVSVMEGDSVTLHTGVTKQQHDKILWYFEDTRIALINGRPNTSCLYDGEGGRFRDRLEVDYETGSLIITNIRSEHVGRYEAEIIRSESSGKRQSLNRNRKCDSTKITRKISSTRDDSIKTFSVIITASLSDQDETKEVPRMEKRVFDMNSGLSSAVLAGIVAVVLLLVSAVPAVIFFRLRSIKNGKYHLQIDAIVRGKHHVFAKLLLGSPEQLNPFTKGFSTSLLVKGTCDGQGHVTQGGKSAPFTLKIAGEFRII